MVHGRVSSACGNKVLTFWLQRSPWLTEFRSSWRHSEWIQSFSHWLLVPVHVFLQLFCRPTLLWLAPALSRICSGPIQIIYISGDEAIQLDTVHFQFSFFSCCYAERRLRDYPRIIFCVAELRSDSGSELGRACVPPRLSTRLLVSTCSISQHHFFVFIFRYRFLCWFGACRY